MKNILKSREKQCPYCGESVEILVDCSVSKQNHIEDCHVCCCPIVLDIVVDEEGGIQMFVSHEDDK